MMCLERLPGSQQFAEFAEEVGADLPPRAREMRAERAAVQAQLAQAYQGALVSSD
jgi:malate synthase